MKESTDPLHLFSILFSVTSSNAKTVVSPCSSPLGTFRRRGEEAVFGGLFLSCRRQTMDAWNWLSWGLQLSFWWSESSDCFLSSSARFYNHSSARVSSRRSNSRAREKNSRRIKKEGRLEGEKGGRRKGLPLLSPSPLPVFPVYNLTPSTDLRALLSERLEQATTHKGNYTLHFIIYYEIW